MDMVIEHILNFLQFDVASIFNSGSSCCLCCLQISQPKYSKSVEKCIENVYEPRPEIINQEEETCALASCDDDDQDDEMNEGGSCNEQCDCDDNCECAECDCECESECDCTAQEVLAKAEAAAKDKCKSKSQRKCPEIKTETDCDQQLLQQQQKERELQEQKERTVCDIVCKQIVTKIAEKCSSSTLRELQFIEERATKLWTTLNKHARPPGIFNSSKCPHWWDLRPWQKLPFYWAALSNEILSEDPFENFKRFYLCQNNQQARRSSKRQHECVLVVWHGMNTKQRMPFIMEAFISKVGAGKVNINDEHEIQKVICDLQNKCC